MNITKYISNLINDIKTFTKDKKINSSICLDNYLIRFTYLSCALNNDDIEIITAKDKIGGYYQKKLILPHEINISNTRSINLNSYIYRLIFSYTSKKLNYYLPQDKKNLDYILLASIITIDTIHQTMYKEFPNIKILIKQIYPHLISTRQKIDILSGRPLLIEIIIRKLMYNKIKTSVILSEKEKLWIYNIENTKKITQHNIKNHLKTIYNDLCDIYKKYQTIDFNQLWGYLYYKDNRKLNILLKDKIKNKQESTKKTNKKQNQQTIIIKKSKLDPNKNKNTLSSTFDYSKTVDNYQGGNKYADDSTGNLDILNDLNIDRVTRTNSKSESIFSQTMINNILINQLEKNINKTKKFTYKEWDFKIKKYKQNWCNIFAKKEDKQLITQHDKNIIDDTIRQYKKEITLFRENFHLMMNKKTWIKQQRNGEDIDLDTIIDNYTHLKKEGFDKLYKYKKNTNKDIAITLLFDSSLSTDSYTQNEKIIELLKNIVLIISCGINELIKNFSIATFYSNTRHDCKYITIKNFHDTWSKTKYNIVKINPNGYTRIGPAIRHSIYELKKIKTKQKLILLLSDGKPTDYDEYEGLYGISDVKHAINEASSEKIHVKSIITDDIPRAYFPSMFGLTNYQLLSHKKNLHTQLLKIFSTIIKK